MLCMGRGWTYPVDLRLSRFIHDAVGELDAPNHMGQQLGGVQLLSGAAGFFGADYALLFLTKA